MQEIVAALQSNCNIIPIIDNFQWPEPEELPEDMRAVCHFNGVRYTTNISCCSTFLHFLVMTHQAATALCKMPNFI